MGMFEDCCSNIMEPYGGNMPLFKSDSTNDATVTIVEEAYDDGMKVTRIQTPPRQNTRTLISAIDNILGMMDGLDIGTMMKDDDKDASKVRSKHEQKDKEQDGDSGKPDGLREQPGSGQKDESERMAEKTETPFVSD